MSFDEAVDSLKEKSGERGFTQSVDLVINVRDLDLDDPDNRFSTKVNLPHSPSDEIRICVIGKTIINDAGNADRVVDPDELDEIIGDDAAAKDLAEEYDFFIAEAPMMPKIGRELGSVLGPRNKMPEPMEPGEDPSERIEELKTTISLNLKENPSIKCKLGEEDMDDGDIVDNAEAVYESVLNHLPRNEHNIKNILVKYTMSTPVEVDV